MALALPVRLERFFFIRRLIVEKKKLRFIIIPYIVKKSFTDIKQITHKDKQMALVLRDIITADLLKKTVLVGIDLTDDAGDAYPDELFEEAIEQAISLIEEELEITIDPFTVNNERHDLYNDQRNAWYGQQLDRRPLKEIKDLKISYGNYTPVQIPDAWLNITSPETASVSLIPTAESIGTFRFSNVLPLLIDPIANYGTYSRVPAYFSYDYTAGFTMIEGTITVPQGQTEVADIAIAETLIDRPRFIFEITDDGNGNIQGAIPPTVKAFGLSDKSFSVEISAAGQQGDVVISYKLHTVPPLIIKAILYTAALLPLDTAGDLLAGAGIGQFSVAVDGLSQNIATTASATSAGYGAKIISYKDQLKTTMAALKKKYKVSKIAAGF